MRIHFIAIGGAIMHQLALALEKKGFQITGSDDVIQEPSKSRLEQAGLLPEKLGFYPENIADDIDIVILGMHAKFDNPELTRAMEKGIKVLSFPEYVYEQSKDKTRVVIAGSHGKTSITSMVMHCLQSLGIDFDYLVGSNVQGFERSVKITEAPIIVIEGDEYLASPILKEPKFMFYKANYAVLSGIEWDHINVFKTEDIYFQQFKKLIHSLHTGATLFYYNEEKIKDTIEGLREDVTLIPYQSPSYYIKNDAYCIDYEDKKYSFEIFGKHNMENLEAAKNICTSLGVQDAAFYHAMQTFSGAGRRLEKIVHTDSLTIYKDFAHSPSKLKATVKAVLEKHPLQPIVACFELHTFSTLTEEFLPNYADSLKGTYQSIVFLDKKVIEQKGSKVFTKEDIQSYFNQVDILFFDQTDALREHLNHLQLEKPVYLMMSSGTFGGLALDKIGQAPSIIQTPTAPLAVADQTLQHQPIDILHIPSIYDTAHLDPKEKKDMTLMFGLSYLTFILSPLYFYFIAYKGNEKVHNIISSCLNFQILISSILGLTAVLNQFYDIGIFNIVFYITILVHIYYTYRALEQLSKNQPLDIPKGVMAILPSIDKR